MIRLLYFLFLFFSLTGSNLSVGPLKIKYLLTIVLFIWVILKDGRFFNNKIIKPYLLYLCSFAICSLVTCHIDFFKQFFLAVFLGTFVGWRATVILANKDEKFVSIIFGMLIVIGLFDVIVTTSQFFLSASWYEPIEAFFQFKDREDVFSDRSFTDDIIGENTSGIFGTSVTNGYYLATCVLLSLHLLYEKKKILLFALPIVFLFGSFVTQQRSAFAIATLLLVVMVYRYFKINTSISNRIAITILFAGMVTFLGIKLIELSALYELRYSTLGLDATGRDSIYKLTFEYILHNPLFPSFLDCNEYVGHAPHNLFLNAYIWGGPIGFIAIMTILYRQMKFSYLIFKNKGLVFSSIQDCSMFAFVAINLIALTHNASIVNGSLLFWVLWGIMSYNKNI